MAKVISGLDTTDYGKVSSALPDRLPLRITSAGWCIRRIPSMEDKGYKRQWQLNFRVDGERLDGEDGLYPLYWRGGPCYPAYPVNIVNGSPVVPNGQNTNGEYKWLASADGDKWWPDGCTTETVQEVMEKFAIETLGTHIACDVDGYILDEGSQAGQLIDSLKIVTNGAAFGSAADLVGRSFVLEKMNSTNDKGKPFHKFQAEITDGQAATPAVPAPATPAAAPVAPATTAPPAAPDPAGDTTEVDAFVLALIANGPVTKGQAATTITKDPDQASKGAKLQLLSQALTQQAGNGWILAGETLQSL